jgi:hypothetical protein
VVSAEHPTAAVEVWATDEHRIGLKPIVRRVWTPRGKRPVIAIHPRYRWRYLSGYVHPASGRTQWHLSSGINVELFTRSLAAFAEQAGAGPSKEIVLVLDRAGWHLSTRVVVPATCIWYRCQPTPQNCSRRSGSGPSPTRRWSTHARRTWKSWTRCNSIAARPCRPIPRSWRPSSPPPTIIGGLLAIPQLHKTVWYHLLDSSPRLISSTHLLA